MFSFFFYHKGKTIVVFFFFQAEDGIRDGTVTGVQTCALPIYVHGFTAQNASGAPLRWDRGDKDTWRVVTNGNDRVTVAFDYGADKIDLSLARAAPEFAQFLGTNLFMFEEGQLARAAEVRFRLPAAWQLTTALKGPTNGVYRAGDYHELADAMT